MYGYSCYLAREVSLVDENVWFSNLRARPYLSLLKVSYE